MQIWILEKTFVRVRKSLYIFAKVKGLCKKKKKNSISQKEYTVWRLSLTQSSCSLLDSGQIPRQHFQTTILRQTQLWIPILFWLSKDHTVKRHWRILEGTWAHLCTWDSWFFFGVSLCTSINCTRCRPNLIRLYLTKHCWNCKWKCPETPSFPSRSVG